MHELALAEGILAVALEAAEGENITSIQIRVGRLQHVTQDSLQFAFELISEETTAEGAQIIVEQVPATYQCKKCGNKGEIQLPHFHCLSCASNELEILSGEEILVDSVRLQNGNSIERCKTNLEETLSEHLREHHGSEHH